MSRKTSKRESSSQHRTNDFSPHISQAEINWTTANWCKSRLPNNSKGWVPVLFFYSSYHYLAACIKINGGDIPTNHLGYHDNENKWVMGMNDLASKYLGQELAKKYLTLYEYARNSRYVPKFYQIYLSDDNVGGISKKYCSEIQNYVQSLYSIKRKRS